MKFSSSELLSFIKAYMLERESASVLSISTAYLSQYEELYQSILSKNKTSVQIKYQNTMRIFECDLSDAIHKDLEFEMVRVIKRNLEDLQKFNIEINVENDKHCLKKPIK